VNLQARNLMVADVNKQTLDQLKDTAKAIRRLIIKITTEAGSGHPSSSLSAVEVVTALYFGGFLRHNIQNPRDPKRDRFILSKGHAVPVLYSALCQAGSGMMGSRVASVTTGQRVGSLSAGISTDLALLSAAQVANRAAM
jgi:transketolase N-terminal domain/subunit